VVGERANQMHFMLVVDEKDLTSPKPIEIQVQKDHIQRDFITFQKRKKENIIVVEIEVEKIEDDEEDLRVQDHDRDLDEDQDRAIEDEEEDRLQADRPDQEIDLVMGQGHAKRKFQKIHFEVENILQIQMMINQSKQEKIGF
jgi:hypothetical protein